MNEKKSIIVDCDDDVVLIYEDICKINKFKETMITSTRELIENLIDDIQEFSAEESESPFKYIKSDFKIEYQLLNCQILQVNGKGWQKGKLNIEICISPNDNKLDRVNLEFFPEEPIKPESPLDDIREMIKAN